MSNNLELKMVVCKILEAFPFLPEWDDTATCQWLLAFRSIPMQFILKAYEEALAGRMSCENVKFPSLPEIAKEAGRWHDRSARYNRQLAANKTQRDQIALQPPKPTESSLKARRVFMEAQMQKLDLDSKPDAILGRKFRAPTPTEALADYEALQAKPVSKLPPKIESQALKNTIDDIRAEALKQSTRVEG